MEFCKNVKFLVYQKMGLNKPGSITLAESVLHTRHQEKENAGNVSETFTPLLPSGNRKGLAHSSLFFLESSPNYGKIYFYFFGSKSSYGTWYFEASRMRLNLTIHILPRKLIYLDFICNKKIWTAATRRKKLL
jgi:hypothetical protein